MVFRKESRADSFQRQISTLRQQLGSDQDEGDEIEDDAEAYPLPSDSSPRIASPAPAMSQPHQPPRMADSATGVVAANSSWSGTLSSDGSVQIFGSIEGELTAADEIYVAEGATVKAMLRARTIVVAGTVLGTIDCLGRLEVLPTGIISGDVQSPTLIVHEGASVEGEMKMQLSEATE
ncbi:MAG: polymer-forming cytoskeletal protein [Thermomicrobiales bacterium]|nr:polymer-forming cytoskeletal protein [Thermomicrobiales bacterium]